MALDCDQIIENRMWVGSYIRPEDVGHLRQLGITTVLSLQSDRDLEYYGIQLIQLLRGYEAAGIELRRFSIPDFDKQALAANLPKAVEELENLLDTPGNKVYLHCTAGVNRAPTLAAAYLIKAKGLTAREAYDYIMARRNCGPYLDTLESYEASLKR